MFKERKYRQCTSEEEYLFELPCYTLRLRVFVTKNLTTI